MKLVILASNCLALRKPEIGYCSMLAKIVVHHCHGNDIELGTGYGIEQVCTLAVVHAGILISVEACRNRLVKRKSDEIIF